MANAGNLVRITTRSIQWKTKCPEREMVFLMHHQAKFIVYPYFILQLKKEYDLHVKPSNQS